MKRLWIALAAFVISCFVVTSAQQFAFADEPAVAATTADLETRIADLEAYVNNGARANDATSKVNGPGPGHNPWT